VEARGRRGGEKEEGEKEEGGGGEKEEGGGGKKEEGGRGRRARKEACYQTRQKIVTGAHQC